MRLETLLKEARDLTSRFIVGIQVSVSLGLTDRNTISETFCLEFFREVFSLPGLRNLNAERENFPGIDLGDEARGRGFQITSDATLEKVKDTLRKVIKAEQHRTYPHIQIFVLTAKQRSYQQTAIDAVTGDKLRFNAKDDVFDWHDILKHIRTFELERLERVVAVLRKHLPEPIERAADPEVAAALDRDMAQRYRRALQRTAFPESGNADQFGGLAQELLDMGAGRVSPALARRIFLRAARAAALTGRPAEADRLLQAGATLQGPDSDLPARARIAEARGDVDDAVRLLRDETDSDSQSTVLSLLSRNKGDDVAIEFINERRIDMSQLTPFGAILVAQIHLRRGDVERARVALEVVDDAQLTDSPFLLVLRGMIRLASVLPKPDQHYVLDGVPIDVRPFRPILEEADLAARLDGAIADFQRLIPAAQELGFTETAGIAHAYLTWCTLLHPYRKTPALAQLRERMREPTKAVHDVHFVLAFDPEFDVRPLQAWLEKRENIGGLDDAELRAILTIRLHADKPAAVAATIAKYRERYRSSLSRAGIVALEIQSLARAGDTTSARLLFETERQTLDPTSVARLEAAIATAEGADPVAEHRRAYETTKTTDALRTLVGALIAKDDRRALAQYAKELFDRTADLSDLAIAAAAFANAGDAENFARLIESHPELERHDHELARRYAWLLLQQGRFQEALSRVADFRQKGKAHDVNLEIALAIETGNWEALGRPLADLLENADVEDGPQLIRAAHIAQASSQGPMLDLVKAAVARGENDPAVLIGAYTIFMEEGLENEGTEAQQWFTRALDLSGPDGPVRQFELKDLLKQQLDWNERTRKVDEIVLNGDVPLIVAAPALRSTIVDLILGNLVNNARLADARKRAVVPLFSGRRLPTRIGEVRRIAFDISSLMVLGWLGILPKVLTAFPEVVLPAGLFYEFFSARRRIRQTQKSRIVRAKQVLELINSQRLKLVQVQRFNRAPLAEQIGFELADLLQAAETTDGNVLRPAPVYRIGLDNPRDADMSAWAGTLTDMHELLKTLRTLGAVQETTGESAEQYFQVQDRGWPSPAALKKERPVYVDSLALVYLQTTGLLEVLVNAFDTVYIHSNVKEEAISLVDAENRADEVFRVIDDIRSAIRSAGQAATKVLYGPRSSTTEKDDLPEESSTLHLLGDLYAADVAVFDDRALNREPFAEDRKQTRARSATSLDLIEELHGRGVLSDAERRSLRHRLREAGAALVPADADEIRLAADRSGELQSPELRAINDSISLVRIRGLLRFPAEVPWFASLSIRAKRALLESWNHEPDLERAEDLSNAIFYVIPRPIDWVSAWGDETPPEWVESVTRVAFASLALPLEITRDEALTAYHRWAEIAFLRDLRTLEPERYQGVIQYVRQLLLRLPEYFRE